MHARWIAIAVMAMSMIGGSLCGVNAQGGWRQWDIYLRDGSKIEANPLSSTDDNHVSHSLKGDARSGKGIERSKINYIAARGAGLPDPPSVPHDHDVVITWEGRKSFGRVTLKSISFSEGVIVQNGLEVSLKDVAYIKFAYPSLKPVAAEVTLSTIASPILAKGEPSLTEAVINQTTDVFEWILNGKFTAAQSDELRQIMVNAWQQNDRTTMEALLSFSRLHWRFAGATKQGQEALRSSMQPDVLKTLREPPVDAISRLLLSVHEAGRK